MLYTITVAVNVLRTANEVCSDPIQFRSGLCLIFSTSGYIAVAARLGDKQEVSECGPPGGFLIMCVDEPYYVVNR